MYNYLTYIIDPYTESSEPYIFLSRDGMEPISISIRELDENEIIVTYDFWMLISYLRYFRVKLPKNIIDVSQVARLLIGQSHVDYARSLPWSIWNLVSPFYKEKEKVIYLKDIFYKKEDRPSNDKLRLLFTEFNNNLSKLWSHQLLDLNKKGEYERYFQIEKPVNEILLERQYEGIKIDEEILLRRLDDIDETILKANRDLREIWNINDIQDKDDFANTLHRLSLSYLASNINSKIFDDLVDIGAEFKGILNAYQNLRKSQRDKKTLLSLGAIGYGRIYPIFESLGTVTGRILVKNPLLQQLKKSSRDVICADARYSLLYPDYSQFEPGILADDSNDGNLINSYNMGDIYISLSKTLFDSSEYRKFAKILFLAFSYGMEKKNIVKLIAELTAQDMKKTKMAVDSFFNQYETVENWKSKLHDELKLSGRIGTRNGNYRYRRNLKSKDLSNVEKRWSISQRIQGTASLILKKVIIKIAKELREAHLLVPMHDAVLYQVPNDQEQEYKNSIERIFIDVYKSECPSIRPRVIFDNFAKND